MTKIDLNPDFKKALKILEETNLNVFLTGKAGSGKSTFLNYFADKTKKNCVILAPTGVAALNVNGETIHSFFHFNPDITAEEVLKKASKVRKSAPYLYLDIIIIDEISMVRADLLDLVDLFLRKVLKNKSPFGGIQMLFIGDLYQLPPVVNSTEKDFFKTEYSSPYFFDAKVIKKTSFKMEFIELEKIYRQKDNKFIAILNGVRNGTVSQKDLDLLNQQLQPNFQNNDFITLTTTNQMANQINFEKIAKIKTKSQTYQAQILGNFRENTYPTEMSLTLKPKAKVMFLNNDPDGLWVNGTLGIVQKNFHDHVEVKIANEIVTVFPHTWSIKKTFYNQETQNLEREDIGSFTQLPLRLSWAITIHKSQGKTFDQVIIDLGRGTFAHGQAYVALSRCTSLKGMIFKKEIKKSHLLIDYKVINFLTSFQYNISENTCSLTEKVNILNDAKEKQLLVEIIYLKAQDIKSKRLITVFNVGQEEYLGKQFLGVQAFCFKKKQKRIFRVDRILALKIIPKLLV